VDESNVLTRPGRELFGLRLDPLTMRQAVRRCTDAIEHQRAAPDRCGQRGQDRDDAAGRAAARGRGGCGMIWPTASGGVGSRVLGAPLPERVAGVDLFMELLAESARRGYRVYFLGARPDVLAPDAGGGPPPVPGA
jgi:N-acetylglucosaminyldiphosphoundecaprenol N-acetyl-beta-D-mannosaminyltransferase